MAERTAPKLRTLILWGVVGIIGYQIGKFVAQQGVELWPPVGVDVVIALGTAAIYVLLGGFILGMRYIPSFRRATTSAEDAEDIEDNPLLFALQAISAIGWGVGLAGLALASVGGPLSPATGLVICLIGMGVGTWTYIRSLPMLDELYRAATLEAAAITYLMVFAIGGGWAGLAHLGFVAAPSMLAVVTLFWILALLGTVLASARRGMLEDQD